MSKQKDAGSAGISMGIALAMIISWDRSHSILYAFLHGLCSWFYVIWFAIWGRV